MSNSLYHTAADAETAMDAGYQVPEHEVDENSCARCGALAHFVFYGDVPLCTPCMSERERYVMLFEPERDHN